MFGVKTGPGDVSPIGPAANLALDLACPNFEIREFVAFSEPVAELFPGTPVSKGGYLSATEARRAGGSRVMRERQRQHGG